MPKTVDHDQRREEIAGAVWRIIRKRGIENVTVRNIVEESGWSLGVLTHYFRDKRHLLLFAFEFSCDQTFVRSRQLAEEQRGLDALRAIAMDVMPFDELRKTQTSVWLTFLALAPSDPAFVEEYRRRTIELTDILIGVLRDMVARGELGPTTDCEREAATLLAHVDGVAAQSLFLMKPDPASIPLWQEMVDSYLQRLLAANPPSA
jgi:AcrR family transcriptional regulator